MTLRRRLDATGDTRARFRHESPPELGRAGALAATPFARLFCEKIAEPTMYDAVVPAHRSNGVLRHVLACEIPASEDCQSRRFGAAANKIITRSPARLFDHFIGAAEQRKRNSQVVHSFRIWHSKQFRKRLPFTSVRDPSGKSRVDEEYAS